MHPVYRKLDGIPHHQSDPTVSWLTVWSTNHSLVADCGDIADKETAAGGFSGGGDTWDVDSGYE